MANNLSVGQALAMAVMLSLAASTAAIPRTKAFESGQFPGGERATLPKVVASASVKANGAPLLAISVNNKKEAGLAPGECF
jgi:hypothetical protein